jgi:hypothetical protein
MITAPKSMFAIAILPAALPIHIRFAFMHNPAAL